MAWGPLQFLPHSVNPPHLLPLMGDEGGSQPSLPPPRAIEETTKSAVSASSS